MSHNNSKNSIPAINNAANDVYYESPKAPQRRMRLFIKYVLALLLAQLFSLCSIVCRCVSARVFSLSIDDFIYICHAATICVAVLSALYLWLDEIGYGWHIVEIIYFSIVCNCKVTLVWLVRFSLSLGEESRSETSYPNMLYSIRAVWPIFFIETTLAKSLFSCDSTMLF